jgi:hypothetical protein
MTRYVRKRFFIKICLLWCLQKKPDELQRNKKRIKTSSFFSTKEMNESATVWWATWAIQRLALSLTITRSLTLAPLLANTYETRSLDVKYIVAVKQRSRVWGWEQQRAYSTHLVDGPGAHTMAAGGPRIFHCWLRLPVASSQHLREDHN